MVPIANAKAALQNTPDEIRWWEKELAGINQRMTELANQHDRNRRDVDQLPRLNHELNRIEERLHGDRQKRTAAIARGDEAVVAVLGPRPTNLAAARDWDQAAGRLHQLDLAYGTTDPSAAYRRLEAHGQRTGTAETTRPPLPNRTVKSRSVGDAHDLGIEL